MPLFSQAHRSSLLAQRFLFVAQKRFNTRESIHRYVEPNKFKKHMLAACEPYIKRVYKLPDEICKLKTSQKTHQLHPLDRIYANELLEDMNNSDFVLIIQYNYCKFQSERTYKNTLTKLGGKFHAFNNRIYQEAFTISNQTNLNSLFCTRNALVTGQADDLPKCVNALGKMPQFLLLAGTIDKQLYNVDQLKMIASSGDLDQCRAMLLNTLSTPANQLSHYLTQHSETLKPAAGVEVEGQKDQ